MPSSAFTELVTNLLDAIGQSMASTRSTPDGLLVTTTDGFLYAFLEDPAAVSLARVEALLSEAPGEPPRLVVFTPGRLPLAFLERIAQRRATAVDAVRFGELARGLGLGPYLGEEPRAVVEPPKERLLPSAQRLDDVMSRATTWLNWGVPALALRFYRQAAEKKPGFLPAQTGIARALLGLGLVDEAEAGFQSILAAAPDDRDARLGLAAVMGARGRLEEEVAMYRTLVDEAPDRLDLRAHLVAALLDGHRWSDAARELESVLGRSPDDARFRFLYAASLYHLGRKKESEEERTGARRLGLSPADERSLAEHLGVPAPKLEPGEASVPGVRPAIVSMPSGKRKRAASPRTPPARRLRSRALSARSKRSSKGSARRKRK